MKNLKTFDQFVNEAKDFSAYDDIKKYKNLKGKRVEYNFGTAKKPDIQKIKIDSIQVSNAGGNSKIKVVAYATRSDKNTVIVPVTSIENIEDYVIEGVISEDRYTSMIEDERDIKKLIKSELRLNVDSAFVDEDGSISFQIPQGPVIYASSLQRLIKSRKFKDASIHYYNGVVEIKLIK